MTSPSVPNLYLKQFSPDFDFPPFAGDPSFLVIASTGRSGSHLLGHTMFATGRLGCPLEYFNPVNERQWMTDLGCDDRAGLLARLVARRTSPNGIFALKLHYTQFKAIGGHQAIRTLLPASRFVMLHREDVLGQAISLVRARQSGSWIRDQPEVHPIEYNAGQISSALRDIILHTAQWPHYIATAGVSAIELTYEQFLRSPLEALGRICDLMQVNRNDLEPVPMQATVAQRDCLNSEWRERYLNEVLDNPPELMRAEPRD